MDLAINGIPFFQGEPGEKSIILATVLKVAGEEVLLQLPGGKLSCRTQTDLTLGETLLLRVKESPEQVTLQIVAREQEAAKPLPDPLPWEGLTERAQEVLTSLIQQDVPPDGPLTQRLIRHLPQSSDVPGQVPALLHLLREELPVNPTTIKALASYYHPRPSLTACLVDLVERLERLPMDLKEPLLVKLRPILSQGLDPILTEAVASVLVESQDGPDQADSLDTPQEEIPTPEPTPSNHENKTALGNPDPIVLSGQALKDLLRSLGVDHEQQLLEPSPRASVKGELLRLLQADLPLDIRRAIEEVLARLDAQQLLPGTRASLDGPLFLAHFELPLNHEGRAVNARVTLQGKGPGHKGLLRLLFLLESNHLGTLEMELIFSGKKISCTTRAKDQKALAFLQDREEHWQALFDRLGYELVHHRFRLVETPKEFNLKRVDIKA
ncbi:MAG: hypothetical protein ACOYCE_01665 [Limnochordia bacterium]